MARSALTAVQFNSGMRRASRSALRRSKAQPTLAPTSPRIQCKPGCDCWSVAHRMVPGAFKQLRGPVSPLRKALAAKFRFPDRRSRKCESAKAITAGGFSSTIPKAATAGGARRPVAAHGAGSPASGRFEMVARMSPAESVPSSFSRAWPRASLSRFTPISIPRSICRFSHRGGPPRGAR